MKKRLEKKILKSVIERLESNRELPRIHFSKARQHYGKFWSLLYVTEFRPWLYSQIETDVSYREVLGRFSEGVEERYRNTYGVNPKLMTNHYRMLKEQGKVRKQKWKPRKERPAPPIRQLKNPSMYKITVRNDPNYRVIGEPAFEYKGLNFFVHYLQDAWTVSNVESGLQVVRDERYKRAISRARELVEKNFDAIKKNLKERGL